MKEAVGGTWLFGIVITFIVFFTTYISMSTNYAKSFKVKDEILMAIEHYKGVNDKSVARISDYVTKLGFYSTGKCSDNSGEISASMKNYSGWLGFDHSGTGVSNASNATYCIRKALISDEKHGPIGHPPAAYYQVVVFFKLDWPVFNTIFNVRVEGETSIIHKYRDTYVFTT